MHILTVLFAVAALFAFLAAVLGRALAQLWVNHRVRLAFLALAESDPGLFSGLDGIENTLRNPGLLPAPRQNYAVTGLILALFGVAGIAYGQIVRVGHLAAGAMLGGIICLAVAFLLGAIGYFLQRK